MALSDLKGFFQNRKPSFLERKQETETVHSFWFGSETPISWKAGQHGGFKVGGKLKPFTIGTADTEGRILLTTEIGERKSEYKQALLSLKRGDTITLNGPVGGFYVKDPDKPHILLAEGVGVIPYRAMLAGLIAHNRRLDGFQLLYKDRAGEHLFQDIWTAAADKGASVYLIDDEAEFRSRLSEVQAAADSSAEYFVAGKPGSVKDTLAMLKSMNIKNISKDVYSGY